MLYTLGRLMQLVGLILLPVAVSGEVAGKLDIKTELIVAGVGIVVFVVGWLVQQAARPPSA